MNEYNLAAIRGLLNDAFTAQDLWRFCQERPALQPVLIHFPFNATQAQMIDALTEYCRTQVLVGDLLAEIRVANPRQYERYQAVLFNTGSLPTRQIPHNLPPRSEFVGRDKEKARIHEALCSRSYLISIEGIGGIGKTSLALEVAYECLHASRSDDAPEGIVTFDSFVWATSRDRELTLNSLLDAVALTLDYPGIMQRPLEQKRIAVERLLRERCSLVLVDNFETITDEGVWDLLRSLPEPSKALITTREQKLGHVFSISLKGLEEPEALALIRGEGRRRDLKSIVHADDETLLHLHRATGGAPLAIKWALGQIKQRGQSLETVLSALYEARGSIFEEVFARSWDLLSAQARDVLVVMPLFATSASREAIEAASDVHHFAFDHALGQLVEMSLLDASDELESARHRYAVHPLTRKFARRMLKSSGNLKQAESRFIDHFSAVSKRLGYIPGVVNEARQPEYPIPPHIALFNLDKLCRLVPDSPNFRAALETAKKSQRWKVMRDILMVYVALLWQTGEHEERLQIENEYGALLEENGMPESHAWLRVENLSTYLVQGRETEACSTIELLRPVVEATNEHELKAYVGWFEARILDQRASRAKADERTRLFEQAERILVHQLIDLLKTIAETEQNQLIAENCRALGIRLEEHDGTLPVREYAWLGEIEIDSHVGSWCELICTLGDILVHQAHLDEAEPLYQSRIRLASREQYTASDLMPWTHVRLARLYYKQHQFDKANRECEAALDLLRRQAQRVDASVVLDPVAQAHAYYWLARVAKAHGNIEDARKNADKSLELFELQQAIPMVTKVQDLFAKLNS